MKVDLENVGLRELKPLPVRVGELGLVRPHKPFRDRNNARGAEWVCYFGIVMYLPWYRP